MLPHYLSHNKKQMGKLFDSRRDARRVGCILKGQGKKRSRPKGAISLRTMPLLVILDTISFTWNDICTY